MELQGNWGLRRLFRPSVESLPESEQLQYYHQRDFLSTHLYRLGINLFGKDSRIRRRVIIAPLGLTPTAQHQTNKTVQKKATLLKTPQVDIEKKAPKTTTFTDDDIDDHEQLSKWISDRKVLRHSLEHFGDCEKWLKSKQCTPLETSVLKKCLANKESHEDSVSVEESDSDDDGEMSVAEKLRLRNKEKRELLRDMTKLERFVGLSKTRIAGYIIKFDWDRSYLVPRELVEGTLKKIRSPVEDFVIELLCDALASKAGKIDYRMLFKGGFARLVNKYIKSTEKHNKADSNELEDDEANSYMRRGEGIDGSSAINSTMGGAVGVWSEKIREQSQRQFEELMEFCEKNQIMLNRSIAERGLLLPTDHSKKQCLSQLRQPGSEGLSRSLFEPLVKEGKDDDEDDLHSTYGWQYKILRGSRGGKRTKLSTGMAKVEAKTDCWLTYPEFQKLTKEIQARPGFDYQYHGLPPNNAFWPGALLDKLRTYLPVESLHSKPYSMYNLFQPVTHPRVYNPRVPIDNTRGGAWPVNSSGHVQLGPSLARTRKTYIL